MFALGGAGVGLLGQAVGDLLAAQLSSSTDYVGAAIGGAAGGVALLYTGPIGAGAVGGATTSLTKQALKKLTCKKCSFDVTSLVVDTGIGAATGFIPGVRIPGISAGRGNYSAIYKQITTKLVNGTIARVSARTAGGTGAGLAFSQR